MNLLTDAQLKATELEGDILVVASAGTGKTTTLVSRCEKFIFSPVNPVTLDRILMVTFTEAAATEMKLRIRRKIEDALIRADSDSIISRQYALLPTAHISTLHSFCLRLIKLYFHELGLDPQIEVLDEGQCKLVALRVLDNIFNKHYAGNNDFDERVQKLIKIRCRGYDEIIRRKILQLHYFASSLPFSELWLKQQLETFNEPFPYSWISLLNHEIHLWATDWLNRMRLWVDVPNVQKCYEALCEIVKGKSLCDSSPLLQHCLESMKDKWQRGTAKNIRDRYFKEFISDLEFLCSLVEDGDKEINSIPLAQDWEIVRHQIITLLELAIEFNNEFSKAKQEINAVDFNDIEQFSLKLLFDSHGNRTRIANELRERFDLIFVDEYQDINPVQHSIISAISRDGGNRFLVGDVKQSIYQFRHANPYIFLKLAEEWQKNIGSKSVVHLTYNFRSHPQILNFVNDIFSVLMTAESSDLDYTEDMFLKPGISQTNDGKKESSVELPRVELHLIIKDENGEGEETENEEQGDSTSEEPTMVQKEAALIAEKIRKLKNSNFEVFDKKLSVKRPLQWHDIAILLRAPANKAGIYAREFELQGIPVVVPCGDVFSAIEVQDLINLLKLLDNPLQDLPLAAVLFSPLVGFSLLELTLLRRIFPKGKLWTALQKFSRLACDIETNVKIPQNYTEEQKQHFLKTIEAAIDKACCFLDTFEKWRKISRQISLSQTLETILDDTQYIAWCQGQADGTRKYANVQVLLETTRQFDPLQRQGLSRFLRFIESREEAEIETEPISSEGENAVKLMSIHQSKGLEFPVVFVSDLGKKFNLMDISSDIILDEEMGICPKIHSELPGQSYPSPTHWIARKRKLRKIISEEIRLLYVATTRACDLLILSGIITGKRIKSLKDKLCENSLPPESIIKSHNMLDWIILWLWQYYKGEQWLASEYGIAGELNWFIRRFNYASAITLKDESKDYGIQDNNVEDYQPDELQILDEKLKWKYPHVADTIQPAKTTVSDIRRQFLRETEEESLVFFNYKNANLSIHSPAKSGKLSAIERGELYHKLLELIDLNKTGSIEDLSVEINRLVECGRLPGEQVAEIDIEKIYQIWNSEIGKLLLTQLPYLRRELPFTIRIGEKDLSSLPYFKHIHCLKNDFVVLQGVVDLAMINDREIWLMDYKTDTISPDELNERAREYFPQLDLYGFALSKIYRRPVARKWLHFISLNRTIECCP